MMPKDCEALTIEFVKSRTTVSRDNIFFSIMEQSGIDIDHKDMGTKWKHHRSVITQTMNHLSGWKEIGNHNQPTWVREASV
jgi:hypothetical protein